jgi:hypothetical protein
MADSLLLGLWRALARVPRPVWRRQIAGTARKNRASFAALTADQRLVRAVAVRELPRYGRPLPPEALADLTGLPLERVLPALDALEKGLTYLFRSPQGAVTWAYPVTVEPSPHRVTFSSGEQLYAA